MACKELIHSTQVQHDRAQRFVSAQNGAARIMLILPCEIIHLIGQHLDRKAMRSLLCFPGRWRNLALEVLLRSIEYCANPHRSSFCPTEFGDCISEGQCPYPHRFNDDAKWCVPGAVDTVDDVVHSTHVQDVGLLLDLLRSDQSLGLLIKKAFFKSEPDTMQIVGEICRMLEPASLLRLHFSGAIPDDRYLGSLQAIPRSIHIDLASPHIATGQPLSLLKPLFKNSLHRSIHIDRFRADDDCELLTPERSSFSPVRTLVFTHGIPKRPFLATMLSWIQDLHHLHLESAHLCEEQPWMGDAFTEFFTILIHHAPNLQKFFIGCADPGRRWFHLLLRPLKQLKSLQELDMPYWLLMSYESRHFPLPVSLQCLTIRVDARHDWGHSFPNDLIDLLRERIVIAEDAMWEEIKGKLRTSFFIFFWSWLTWSLLERYKHAHSLKRIRVIELSNSEEGGDDQFHPPLALNYLQCEVQKLLNVGIVVEMFVRDEAQSWEHKGNFDSEPSKEWYRI